MADDILPSQSRLDAIREAARRVSDDETDEATAGPYERKRSLQLDRRDLLLALDAANERAEKAEIDGRIARRALDAAIERAEAAEARAGMMVVALNAAKHLLGSSDTTHAAFVQCAVKAAEEKKDAEIASHRACNETLTAELERLKDWFERKTPWLHADRPLDAGQFLAIQQRWATGPERYQQDADALICTVIDQRRELARLRAGSSELQERAVAAGATQRWVTPDGYTQLPASMTAELGNSHVWFLPGKRHWTAWPEADLDEALDGGADKGPKS